VLLRPRFPSLPVHGCHVLTRNSVNAKLMTSYWTGCPPADGADQSATVRVESKLADGER
jgi:hypothetical protein